MLEQVALSIAGKKLAMLAAGGALAASATVYSQADISGGVGGNADFGLGQTIRPIMADIHLDGLLPSVTAESEITADAEAAAATEAESTSNIDDSIHLDLVAPVIEVSTAEGVAVHASGSADNSSRANGNAAVVETTETTQSADIGASAHADIEAGAAGGDATAITADLATTVEGGVGIVTTLE